MRASCLKACLLLTLTVICTPTTYAGGESEQWPAWRGPKGDGSSQSKNVPVEFSDTKNVRWKLKLNGVGHSSPILWDNTIFVTFCDLESKARVLAKVDRRTGKYLWQKTILTADLEKKHRLNSFASATPATDGKHVWVAFMDFPRMIVACYDYEGNEIWRASPGKLLSKHGFCSSPILYRDLVILNGDQDAQGFLVALNQKTGKEVWRTERPNRTRSYCTPIILNIAGKDQLVMSGSKCVTSYDPATGKRHWIIDGPTEQYVASLVETEGVLFLTTGFPEYHLMGIRPDGTGNVTKTHVQWHHADLPAKEASYVPSPVAYGKYFFVVSDRGYASCFDAKTGKRQWIEKLGKRHSASPVLIEDRIYFPSDHGKIFVVRAAPKYELIATNDVREECYASPAIAGGELFLRTLNHLWCIAKDGK